ncbi:hypothetical protein [Absidia glauca]|uniref:FAD dependent oxidoreductase domain-containing protein n=1 Tax=Absidia glauca TaxID=4829 RepID=A0A163MIA4_ABSGL|nr:hypothetical protein [Absidia glauca]
MFTSTLPRVHVVGANAYGYTTAILLLLQGYKVTMIASTFPGDPDYYSTTYHADDTTSHWQTFASISDASLQRKYNTWPAMLKLTLSFSTLDLEYDSSTFKMLWKLAKCKAVESGIMIGDSFKYYQNPTEDQLNPWWKHIVPGFEIIQQQELPKDVKLGYHYTTVLINTKRYISWLQTQFLSMGGRQRKTKINKLLDAITTQDHVNIIVNCVDDLQLEASSTTQSDPSTKLCTNQWIVRASQVRKSVNVKTKDGDMYIYPRGDGTIVVGSRRQGTSHSQENPTDVLETLSGYCPELKWGKGLASLEIIDHHSVVKSIRNHGPRIENQFIVTPSGRKLAVTHNYGHNGYQSTWGSSKRAIRLVNEAHARLEKDSQSMSELLSHL